MTYDYDELGKLCGKTYGSGANAVSETLEYNIQGGLTGQFNPRFSMKLWYFDATKAPAASYTGNLKDFEKKWRHVNKSKISRRVFIIFLGYEVKV